MPAQTRRRAAAGKPRFEFEDGAGGVFRTEATYLTENVSDLQILTDIAGRRAGRDLLERFGGVAEAIGAAPYEVAQVAGPDVARSLRIIQRCAVRMGERTIYKRCLLSTWSALLAYLKTKMAHESVEQFRVLFLDKKNQLIVDELMNRGTVDHAPVYPREVIKRALVHDASAIILCHNHPSGDPTPSKADVEMTRMVIEAGRAVQITVHDHVVVGRDGVASLKSLGLI